jgi:hypothetical protein
LARNTLTELDLLGAWENAPSATRSAETESFITNPKVLDLFTDQESSLEKNVENVEKPKQKFRKLSSSSRSSVVEHHGWAHPELFVRLLRHDEHI